ncbi:basic helix-loop-helix (bHLH) DNA-binding superfamily protein [Actinidia rufa]|uniref:Basic helix-loop-helix (BHLH) DNA-binding superfamily protein n=1 Tax=Actinidia rufa TaxID=165716 RepID=A0A7J0EHC7_9ERIC|nr:basic helix-loop-helix (bHLH) DNA-binding superfamily protein [Actinidia rufa]
MALDAMEYPPDLFGYAYKELHTLSALWGGYEQDKSLIGILDNSSSASSHAMQNGKEYWDPDSSPEAGEGSTPAEAPGGGGRRKRRRTKSSKNKEELESQRMTHIAVERNRRKQMNEYLAIVRSLMPASYVQRELEQLLQVLEAQKRTMNQQPNNALSPIFSDFFTFPQYSTTSPVGRSWRGIGGASAGHGGDRGDDGGEPCYLEDTLEETTQTAVEVGGWDPVSHAHCTPP